MSMAHCSRRAASAQAAPAPAAGRACTVYPRERGIGGVFATMPRMTAADLQATIAHLGVAARAAATTLAAASTAARNAALLALARRLRDERTALQAANARDLAAARTAGLAEPLIDRLTLGDKAIATVAEGCEQIAAMPDPIREIIHL